MFVLHLYELFMQLLIVSLLLSQFEYLSFELHNQEILAVVLSLDGVAGIPRRMCRFHI